MKNFKIKVEKEDNQDFLIWVLENYKANVPKMLKGPYYFLYGNNITQSTKYFEFKYKKLTEYVWVKSEKIPVDKKLCVKCVCVDESNRLIDEKFKDAISKLKSLINIDHEIESYPSSENYSNLKKALDQARAAAVKLNNELKQLDESIKKDPKINVGNQNKTMKKQTEYFSIDLSKVDRLEADNLIKSVGGVFQPSCITFKITGQFLNYDLDLNTFWYGGMSSENTITSITELKKQLGIDDKEEERDYVLTKKIKVAVDNNTEKVYEKGYPVKKLKERWFSSANHCYFSVDNKYIVTLDYVEERKPLLSDIVKFGDELECISDGDCNAKFVGETYLDDYCIFHNGKNKVVMYRINDFNKYFKLKK